MNYFKSPGFILPIILVSIMAILAGCSTGADISPVAPAPMNDARIADTSNHVLWGYYQFSIDAVAEKVDVVPLRQTAMHLNAMKYLETPTSTLVSIESPPHFYDGSLLIDIGLTHPLPQKLYTGFDVRGILISRGSEIFDGGYILPGLSDLRLEDADGYTRYWNPTEFGGSGYQDGILGTPNAVGNFNATVNGYMYFGDDVGVYDELRDIDTGMRGAFSTGTMNVREYEIILGNSGLLFNYAVDASWAMPDQIPPTVPDDFDPQKANSKEAWFVDPHVTSFITPDGGECTLDVDVYDWQGMATIEGVYVQAPDIFTGTKQFGSPVDYGDYVTYSITFANELGGYGEYLPILVRVRDTEAATNPYLESFVFGYVPIVDVEITLDEDEDFKTPGTDYVYGREPYDLGSTAAPVDYLDTNGPWDFTQIDFSDVDHRIALAKNDPLVADFVNDFPAAVEYFFLEGDPETGVFRAESHNHSTNQLNLHGIVTNDATLGTIVFSTPATYQYPISKTTSFTVHKEITIIPFVLTAIFDFKVTALGQGWARVPYDDGEWFNVLLLRNTIEMSTGGLAGEGWMATYLAYEWTSDEGDVVAMLGSNNVKDEPANFNETTYTITSECEFAALQQINNF